MQPLQGNTAAFSKALFGDSGDEALKKLEAKKSENLHRLDEYTKQEKDADEKQKIWTARHDMAVKKKPLFTALFWGVAGAGIALTAATAFVCLPVVSLVAVGSTTAACFAYKKKEFYENLEFHSGQLADLDNMSKELIKSGRAATNEELKDIEKEIAAHVKKKAAETETLKVDIDADDTMLIVDGIRLPKRAMKHMSPELRSYAQSRQQN